MATTLIIVDCKLFQMMRYISILKVRKFHQPTANRFSTAKKKPVGGHNVLPPRGLNMVNYLIKMAEDETSFSEVHDSCIFFRVPLFGLALHRQLLSYRFSPKHS